MAKTRTPAQTKAAKAEAKAARKAASKQRRTQLLQAFQMQRKEDKQLLPLMIGGFLAALPDGFAESHVLVPHSETSEPLKEWR